MCVSASAHLTPPQVLNVAWARHEIVADQMGATLDWIDRDENRTRRRASVEEGARGTSGPSSEL